MKASELRKENIVHENVLGNCTIVEINRGSVTVELNQPGITYNLYYSSIKPIPLTEEWLVKFGWQYLNGHTSGTLTKDTNCKLDIDFIDGKIQVKSHYESADFYRVLENIKYVHNIQNLFSDLGEELKIK
jgi:hypothetical protein